MKKILLIFCAVLIFGCLGEANAQRCQEALKGVISKKNAIPYDYCTTCPDADEDADIICEVPDGTADGLCGWTITSTGDATGTVDPDYSCGGAPAGCADINPMYCFRFVKTDVGSGNMQASYTITATTTYIQFYIKILADSLVDGNAVWLVSNSSAAVIQLYHDGGSLYFARFKYADTDTRDPGTTPISTGKWYGIRMLVVNTTTPGADSVQWWVDYCDPSCAGTWYDEGSIGSITFDFTAGNIRIGGTSLEIPFDFVISGLKVDTAAFLSCTR